MIIINIELCIMRLKSILRLPIPLIAVCFANISSVSADDSVGSSQQALSGGASSPGAEVTAMSSAPAAEVASASSIAMVHPVSPASAQPLPVSESERLLAQLKTRAHVEVRPYVIRGGTPQELSRQIDTLGPVDRGGHREAMSSWTVNWTWPPGEHGGGAYDKAEVSYQIVLNLPAWERPAQVDQATVTSWERYANALYQHEMDRVNLIEQGIPRILDAIRQAGRAGGKISVADINSAANRVVREIRSGEEQKDRAVSASPLRQLLLDK